MVSLSMTNTTEGPLSVLLPARETRQRLDSNLANNGVFVMINNPSNAAVNVKLWVED